nr:pre-mRNA-processing factor 39-like [Anser cygnoides]
MDLWIHYISYLQSTLDMSLPESIQKIRGVFEAAVAAAGMDFRSDKLWELYVEWERERGDLRAVTAIYDRVLSMPTQLYSHHWERCVGGGATRKEGGKTLKKRGGKP